LLAQREPEHSAAQERQTIRNGASFALVQKNPVKVQSAQPLLHAMSIAREGHHDVRGDSEAALGDSTPTGCGTVAVGENTITESTQ
jgi:hypothetical protein